MSVGIAATSPARVLSRANDIFGFATAQDGVTTDSRDSFVDPRFILPAGGDYRLASDSPLIDAGDNSLVPPDLTVDLDGHARAIDGRQRGQAIVDMGAYEFQNAVNVTISDPNGSGPWHGGQNMAVSWRMDLDSAGTAILMRLARDGDVVADFGAFWTPSGSGQAQLTLPPWLPPGDDYVILGISSWDQSLQDATAPLTILSSAPAAVRPDGWIIYRCQAGLPGDVLYL